MIRRFCFSVVFCLGFLGISGIASAQFLMGANKIPTLREPQFNHSKPKNSVAPLAKPFTVQDTFKFGSVPQNAYVYGTFDVANAANVIAILWALPFSYQSMQFKPMDDSGFEYPAIEPKSTTSLNYSVAIDPNAYQQEFQGGPMAVDFGFGFFNVQGSGLYQLDTVWMFANPLPFDTVGHAPVVKLVHYKTESLPVLITSNQVSDLTQVPEFYDTFYIENAEKDSLEVTTGQYWGNTIFTGATERTTPFKLAPGERARVFTHFTPGSVPDTVMTYYPNGDSIPVAYYYDEFVFGTDKTLGVKFQSNATASGYKPSRIATAPPPPPDAVNDPKFAVTVKVYPNPVARTLHLTGVQGQSIELLDLLGREIMQCRASYDKVSLDCSTIAVGNYMLRIGNDVRPVTIAR